MNMIRSTISLKIFKGLFLGIAVFALTLTMLISVTRPASADMCPAEGVRYDPNSINPISYKFFFVTLPYTTAFQDAQAKWDATSSPGYFEEQSWSLDPEIHVSDGEYVGSDWAFTLGYADENNYWVGNEVEIGFDIVDMNGFDAYQKKLIAEHELGHAYGLRDHNVSHAHVMIQGEEKFEYEDSELPSAGDVSGVDNIY